MVDHEHFSRHEEVLWKLHHLLHLSFHEVVDIDSHRVIVHFLWVWFDVHRGKVAHKLVWNLGKNFFSESIWIVFNISEWNELNDISSGISIQFLTKEWCIISIKLIHLIEVSITNSYNDN